MLFVFLNCFKIENRFCTVERIVKLLVNLLLFCTDIAQYFTDTTLHPLGKTISGYTMQHYTSYICSARRIYNI